MVAEIICGKSIPSMKRRGAPPKYPWLQLQPGEAFRFDGEVTFSGARSMASQHTGGVTAKWKFIVRQCEDGIWCWRVDGTEFELQNGNEAQFAPKVAFDPAAKPATRQHRVTDITPKNDEEDVI